MQMRIPPTKSTSAAEDVDYTLSRLPHIEHDAWQPFQKVQDLAVKGDTVWVMLRSLHWDKQLQNQQHGRSMTMPSAAGFDSRTCLIRLAVQKVVDRGRA